MTTEIVPDQPATGNDLLPVIPGNLVYGIPRTPADEDALLASVTAQACLDGPCPVCGAPLIPVTFGNGKHAVTCQEESYYHLIRARDPERAAAMADPHAPAFVIVTPALSPSEITPDIRAYSEEHGYDFTKEQRFRIPLRDGMATTAARKIVAILA